MKTNPNESAFPEVQPQPQFNSHSYGLTKLEYFTAMAAQGICANPRFNLTRELLAEASVRVAKSIINELNK
jgi:hypothetical protein